MTDQLPAVEPVADAPPSALPGDAAWRSMVLDAMPVAVLLVDDMGMIVYANGRAGTMLGLAPAAGIGLNVLDFVDVDDLDFAAELLSTTGDHAGELMGPAIVRYVDAAGRTHTTQVWAHRAPAGTGVAGFILTLTGESVRDVLADAVSAAAAGAALKQTLASAAMSVQAHPMESTGGVLLAAGVADEHGPTLALGDWPVPDHLLDDPSSPWARAIATGSDIDVHVDGDETMSHALLAAMRTSGIAQVWVRAVPGDGRCAAAIVTFRRVSKPPSPNQQAHLDDIVRVVGLVIDQHVRHQYLQEAAHSDPLTGAANRAAFMERLETERRACDVLFVDLDHFKAVNDTFGHDIGDQVLAAAAERLMSCVRHDDDVYRTGGDEFVVVCEPGSLDRAGRVTLAERIIDCVMQPYTVDGIDVQIAATIGIASGNGRILSEAVSAADRSMLVAKERGRAGWAHAHDIGLPLPPPAFD
ncbi:MAG: sensor domain-containing diguanylate cyclase [Actinomycetota bacterium]